MGRLRVRRIALSLGLGLAFAAPAQASPATSMQLGFLDGGFASTQLGPARLKEASAVGATVARLPSGWDAIARTRPADPTNPADPAYDWTSLDAMVRMATSAGQTPVVSLTGAPSWAEGPDRPSTDVAPPGTWRPDAAAYGQFARALAARYSGHYPDPLRAGAPLPRVRDFLAWNEPNLSNYLTPQWIRSAGKYVATSPIVYRQLLRAFYDGVHAVQGDARVIGGALAPFGDLSPGGKRIMPASFLRTMLCLSKHLRKVACGTADPRMDVLAHHPYSVGGPFQSAINADDVSVPDVAARLIKPLRKAEKLGLLGSRRARPVWVTEISWDSNPPDPEGVPAARHARWLAQALYVLARQGVSTVLWFQVRDQLPDPTYAATSQSGVLLANGTPKPAATAFAFPFVAVRDGRRARLWALAPADGTLAIERRTPTGWVPIVSRSVRRGQVVTAVKAVPKGARLRSRLGSKTSLTLGVSAPK